MASRRIDLMITLRHIRNKQYENNALVGTGGIGSGIFFALQGNETMGRNESRMATLLPYKDYCKQHIILHYVAVLLGAGSKSFQVYPIGKVGDDSEGKMLMNKMNAVGMDTGSVSVSTTNSTMFSVCYQYPDKSGGNITTANSACNEIGEEDIYHHFQKIPVKRDSSIMLAAPEVDIQARIALLKYGRESGSLNIACVSSAEVQAFRYNNGINLTDLISLNIDEAMHFAETVDQNPDKETIAEKCFDQIKSANPGIRILITNGSSGVFSCDENNHREFTPAIKVKVTSTAGAGDAFLAGVVCGINCGLPFSKNKQDSYFGQSPLTTAIELGILVASMSVTAADTINSGINASSLIDFIKQQDFATGDEFLNLFDEKNTTHVT